MPVEGQKTGPESAARAVAAGAFVAIAHPQWSGMTMAVAPDHFGGWVMVTGETNDPVLTQRALAVAPHITRIRG